MVNAWWEPLPLTIPPTRAGQEWHCDIDTFQPETIRLTDPATAGREVVVGPRSITVLRGPRPGR